MKRTLHFLQMCLLICGVFGVDADEVKTVTVMEGDSVTLNTDPTKIQGFNQIQWVFRESGPVIAQIDENGISYPHLTEIFGGRLQLDLQTGSLAIKNMRIKHNGLYKLKISQNTGSSFVLFSVDVYESPADIGVGKAEMKSVSVTEGVSVTLQTDVTETLGDELIVWRFGDEGKLIAKHDIEAKSSKLYDTDERFRDRLQLDNQTGSLNIMNSRTTDSGLYTVKISSNSKQTLYKRFIVTVSEPGLSSGAVAGIFIGVMLVFAAAAAVGVIYYHRKISELESQKLKKVSVMEGDDVTLNTDVTEIQKDDLIEWRFGDGGHLIAVLRGGIIEVYDTGLNVSFTDRLKLDKKTGSLTIMDSRTTDSGLYQLMIRQDSKVKYKMFNVSVCENTVSVSVFEGERVILKTDAELQRDDLIEWIFGVKKEHHIAEIRRGKISKFDDVADGRFRGRLELDEKTGSLTITNSEVKHAGVYQLLITPISGPLSYKKFTVDLRTRNISVTDGKNMILNPETEIQKDDQIQWMFGDKEILIAEVRGGTGKTHDADRRFRGRLKLDEKIGSLIIRDLTADHSGDYKLQISNSRGNTNTRFVVAVNPRRITVDQGKSVTLETNTEIQKDDQIQWRFGDILIAEVRGGTGETHDDVADGRFRGRLKLDEKIGSLIITDLTADHPGDYKLQIISSRGNTNMRFVVAVYPSLKSVTEGESVTLETDTEIHKDDQIQWRFGDEDILIAEVSGGTGETHDDADGRFRGRLTLDEKTGFLTIARIRKEHSYGVFKLQIINSRGTTNKRFLINEVYSAYTYKTVLEGKDVTLSSDTDIVKDERVKWLFNDKSLATGMGGDINKTSYCDEKFKNRLEFNLQTGSLTIKNIRTSDSGDYHLKFLILGIERKFHVTVNESAGNRVNDSATVQMPPVDEEDPDVGNKQEGMSLLVR